MEQTLPKALLQEFESPATTVGTVPWVQCMSVVADTSKEARKGWEALHVPSAVSPSKHPQPCAQELPVRAGTRWPRAQGGEGRVVLHFLCHGAAAAKLISPH